MHLTQVTSRPSLILGASGAYTALRASPQCSLIGYVPPQEGGEGSPNFPDKGGGERVAVSCSPPAPRGWGVWMGTPVSAALFSPPSSRGPPRGLRRVTDLPLSTLRTGPSRRSL